MHLLCQESTQHLAQPSIIRCFLLSYVLALLHTKQSQQHYSVIYSLCTDVWVPQTLDGLTEHRLNGFHCALHRTGVLDNKSFPVSLPFVNWVYRYAYSVGRSERELLSRTGNVWNCTQKPCWGSPILVLHSLISWQHYKIPSIIYLTWYVGW